MDGTKVEVRGSRSRCPYCHDGVAAGHDDVVCHDCLARHHKECWSQHDRCSSCDGRTPLAPVAVAPPAVPLLPLVVRAAAAREPEPLTRVPLHVGSLPPAVERALAEAVLPGEEALWFAQPPPAAAWWRHAPAAVLGLGLLALGCVTMPSVGGALVLPFGAALVGGPFFEMRDASATVYALFDDRLIVVSPKATDALILRSGDAVRVATRGVGATGRGDVVVEHWRGRTGELATLELTGVADATRIAALVRERLGVPAAAAGSA